MLGRVLSIGVIGLMVASIVALAGIALWSRDQSQDGSGVTLSEVATEAADDFVAQAGQWRVAGRVIGGENNLIEFEFTVTDEAGNAAPPDLELNVSMTMLGHAMAPVPAKVQRGGDGAFTAAAELSMRGAWRARIALPDGAFQVPVRVGR